MIEAASLHGAMERVGENFSLFYETVSSNVGQSHDKLTDRRRQNVAVEQPLEKDLKN